MADDLPDYYFRVSETGATVFRLDAAQRQGRLEMEPLAVVNIGTGKVRPRGSRVLLAADRTAIEDWLANRRALVGGRRPGDVQDTVDRLNLTAQWAQTRASDAEVEDVTQALLLAMHDLRSVLVRRKAVRLTPDPSRS